MIDISKFHEENVFDEPPINQKLSLVNERKRDSGDLVIRMNILKFNLK